MIKKTMDTATVEIWSDSEEKKRYLFKKEWSDEANLVVVITIHPGSVDTYVSDMTTMLIEKQTRQLGYSGFLALNLFPSTRVGKQFADLENLEVIQTIITNMAIKKIIFACGSITSMNKVAEEQQKKIFEALPTKLKKMSSVLVTDDKKPAHPLNVYCRNNWQLSTIEDLFVREK